MGDSLFGALGLPPGADTLLVGFGCRVPGLLSVRILPSEKARRTASVLIAALVPCTATVSLAWATLARFGGNPLVPCAALSVSAVGLSKILRLAGGEPKDSLVLEQPPLRLPALRNVAMKTHLRLTGFSPTSCRSWLR
jgi:ferrous iron transport protein B